MRYFEEYNPVVVAVYFLLVAGVAMFCMNPVILSLSLTGALLLYFSGNGVRNAKTHLYSLGLFLILALINPLVSHNGVTVLFVMNHNPVTLEAVIYGVAAAGMILSVLYWFRTFSQIMTSDKLLYIFGAFSPKLALILSMALRYVPLFGSQAKKINRTQRALGLYKEDNVVDNYRGGLRVFSILITWALENGIITADSMTARGYGIGKRTHFSGFRFRKRDVLFLCVTLLLFIVTVVGINQSEYAYYPAFRMTEPAMGSILGYASYGLLILLPTILEVKEAFKWKYLTSKI